MKSLSSVRLWLGFMLIGWNSFLPTNAQNTGPTSGQTVAYLGDSITALGGSHPTGYIHLVSQALAMQGTTIKELPAGVIGNTSKDLLARLNADILVKKPDWVILNCGLNDVWFGDKGVPLDQYQQNMTSIVDQLVKVHISPIILTTTMIGEDENAPNNKKLEPYNDFLRSLAKNKSIPLVDLNTDMRAKVVSMKAINPYCNVNYVTTDGVHMNGIGDEMIAADILKTFGFTDKMLAQVEAEWVEMPDAITLSPVTLSVHQYMLLQTRAASEKNSVEVLVNKNYRSTIDFLVDAQEPGYKGRDPEPPPKK